jgi:hypothetical protein
LGARLTKWDIDILTPAEYDKSVDALEHTLKTIPGVEDVLLDKLLALGFISLADLSEVGVNPLVTELELSPERAKLLVDVATEAAAKIAAGTEASKKAVGLVTAEKATETGPGANGDAAAVESAVAAAEPTPLEPSAEEESGPLETGEEEQDVVGSNESV